MSMDSSTISTSFDGEEKDSSDLSVEDISWHISLDGYWDDIDERFYGENTPNEPPLINVPEKLAADAEYIDDEELATEVAKQWDMNSPERYEAVINVLFNDFSTWRWPILVGDYELTQEVKHFIDKYMPQIVQWDAIVKGDDPDEALQRWRGDDQSSDYSWTEDVDNTEIDEQHRKELNNDADWLPHIQRTVDSPNQLDSSEIDDEGSWVDDW